MKMKNKKKHIQKCIKTNAFVDIGIAEIISVLSTVPNLITIESCEGKQGWGFVTFWYGDWQNLCRFLFKKLAPSLNKELGEDISINATLYGHDIPQGEIKFRIEAKDKFASILKRIIYPPPVKHKVHFN